jgi:hypothetical protein
MEWCRWTLSGRWLAILAGAAALWADRGMSQEPVPVANLVLGTQAIGGKYQFTAEDPLVESAKVVAALGASNFKFALRVPKDDPEVRSVAELVEKDPAYAAVLGMPFRDFLMWVDARDEGAWITGLDPVESVREYRQMYQLTVYLLRTFAGSGKHFHLGHWEGDNMLRPEGIGKAGDAAMADGVRVRGFADWLRIRQQAVDDAKRDTPHRGVAVWHYTEVNHPTISLLEGRPSLASEVLPQVDVDFVSYSAYDSQSDPALLVRVLDYLQAQMKPKVGLEGRRVFIGEYGFPLRKDGQMRHSAAEQQARSVAVIRAGLEWGCPFILYWQLYNNELEPDGTHRGFWMIDDRGVEQPIHATHRRFYAQARRWHEGRVEDEATGEAFRRAAVGWLE